MTFISRPHTEQPKNRENKKAADTVTMSEDTADARYIDSIVSEYRRPRIEETIANTAEDSVRITDYINCTSS